MVILNKEILICKATMINSIKNIMQKVLEEYFDNEMLAEKIENKKKIMKNIISEEMNITKENHFWYVNSSDKVCSYIHKRGIKEGYICHRKINTNLEGQKPDFLCSKHSKLYTPKKRNKKITKKMENAIDNIEKKKKRKKI